MLRPFDLIQELGHVVDRDAGLESSQVSNLHAKGFAPLGRSRGQTAPQGFVDDRSERQAGPPRLRLELRSHVIVESERRTHIVMLARGHHDVKLRSSPLPHSLTHAIHLETISRATSEMSAAGR